MLDASTVYGYTQAIQDLVRDTSTSAPKGILKEGKPAKSKPYCSDCMSIQGLIYTHAYTVKTGCVNSTPGCVSIDCPQK